MTGILIRACSFVCLIFLAYLFKKFRLLHKEDFRILSTLVAKITLPCAIVVNLNDFDFDFSLLTLTFIGFTADMIMIGVAYLIYSSKSRRELAFQMINHSGYNVGSFALPYLQAFLGPLGVAYCCMFDTGNAVVCNGGSYALASAVLQENKKISLGSVLKTTFTAVPLITYLTMICLRILHFKMPLPILSVAQIGGAANGFLSMAMLGVGMELSLKKNRLKKIGKTFAARYGFAALFALCAWFLLPLSYDMKKTLVLLLFAPLASFDTISTRRCGGDVSLSSELNSISILISLACMTLLLIIL